MSAVHDIDYYARTERTRVVEDAKRAGLSLRDILQIPDVYVRYFLLTSLEIPSTEGSAEVLRLLKKLFVDFACAGPLVVVDFNERMGDFVRRKIVVDGMEDFVCCISELDPDAADLVHYREFFGYSQIYGLYKKMLKTVFSCKFGHREIGLVIRLLDNEDLCFRKLLPVFSRLTGYVKNNVIDRNIVACCIVLRAVLKNIPGVLAGRDEYIASLVSYFVGIVSQRATFAFINEKDADEIIATVDVLANYKFSTAIGQTMLGIFKELVFRLETLIQSRTAVYEEVFAMTCMLHIIQLLRMLLQRLGTAHSFSDAYLMIQDAWVSRMEHIPEREWRHIGDRFLAAKYRALDALHEELLFDRILFYNDIARTRRPSRIFEAIEGMKNEILWSDLIVPACALQSQGEYLRLVFDRLFMARVEHLVYVDLFVRSIEEPDILLYSGYLLLRAFEVVPECEKKWEVLADLYMHSIESRDQRVARLREIISEHVCGIGAEQKEVFLGVMVERLGSCVCLNTDVGSLLHSLLRRNGRMSPGVSRLLVSYILDCVVQPGSDGSQDQEAEYLCAAAKAIIDSGNMVFDADCVQRRYYSLAASSLAWRRGVFPQESFDTLREKMFDFLFEAERSQIVELGMLVRDSPSRLVDAFDRLYSE